MKHTSAAKILILTGLMSSLLTVQAQNIFVGLRVSGSASTLSVAAPTGSSYSGAAPVTGTTWNLVPYGTAEPSGTVAGNYTLVNGDTLESATGGTLSSTLSVVLTQTSTSGHANPANATGENTIQPGGVMDNAWRNYNNSSGYYYTFTVTGLTADSPYNLYVYGGTGTSGQAVQIQWATSTYDLGSDPTSVTTANTTQNSNGVYGSIWTSNGAGGYTLMAEGTTWNLLQGQSDSSGDLEFEFIGTGSLAYFNGFQLTPGAVPEPPALALGGIGLGLIGGLRRFTKRA